MVDQMIIADIILRSTSACRKSWKNLAIFGLDSKVGKEQKFPQHFPMSLQGNKLIPVGQSITLTNKLLSLHWFGHDIDEHLIGWKMFYNCVLTIHLLLDPKISDVDMTRAL